MGEEVADFDALWGDVCAEFGGGGEGDVGCEGLAGGELDGKREKD